MQLVEVTHVRALAEFHLQVSFSDGFCGIVDFRPHLWGPVFEPVKDPSYFSRVFVSEGTVCWPNGADFAPEVLRQEAVLAVSAA